MTRAAFAGVLFAGVLRAAMTCRLCDDCRVWQLTPLESAHYHARVSMYLSGISQRLAAKARHQARTSIIASAVAGVMSVVMVTGLVIAWI